MHCRTLSDKVSTKIDAPLKSFKKCSGEDLYSNVDGIKAQVGEESARLRNFLGRMRICPASWEQAGGLGLADLGNLMLSRAYVALTRTIPPEGPGRQCLEGMGALEEQLLINHNTLMLPWFGYLAYLYQHSGDLNS